MANWGNTASTSSSGLSCKNNFQSLTVTINETGDLTAIVTRVAEQSVANEHSWKAHVYDDSTDLVLLGSSNVLTDVSTSYSYRTFTFATPISVNSGDTVDLAIWTDDGTNNAYVAYDAGSGGYSPFGTLQNWPTPPDPWAGSLHQATSVYPAIYAVVSTGGGRSADSLTGDFRRGNTGVTVECTGLDASPTTQTVTVTDGTHSDTCTITNWNSGDPIIDIDCDLPPGTYDIQVTDDTGTVTLDDQTLLIETGFEEVVYNGVAPPANEESLSAGTLEDFPAVPEFVAGDSWGVESHANITWQTDGQADISPAGEHTLDYWFWDDSTGVMYSGETITFGEQPALSSPTLSSTGQNTMDGTVDTDTDTGTIYGYWSTSGNTSVSYRPKGGNRSSLVWESAGYIDRHKDLQCYGPSRWHHVLCTLSAR